MGNSLICTLWILVFSLPSIWKSRTHLSNPAVNNTAALLWNRVHWIAAFAYSCWFASFIRVTSSVLCGSLLAELFVRGPMLSKGSFVKGGLDVQETIGKTTTHQACTTRLIFMNKVTTYRPIVIYCHHRRLHVLVPKTDGHYTSMRTALLTVQCIQYQ